MHFERLLYLTLELCLLKAEVQYGSPMRSISLLSIGRVTYVRL